MTVAAPAVTVVVPTAAVDAALDRQLHAVLAQSLDRPFEVVVSLNAPRLVLGGFDERVRTVDSSERKGPAHARNVGAASATAPLLAFCDADDLVHPGWLAALVDALDTADAVGGKIISVTPTGDVPSWVPQVQFDELPSFLGVPYILSGNLGIRRDVFDSVGGFDETLTRCEDIAIGWELVRRGAAIRFAPDAVLDYTMRPSIRTMVAQHYRYGIGMSEVLLRKGRPGDSGRPAVRTMIRANNQAGGMGSPVALLRKAAIGAGRLVGIAAHQRSRLRRA